LDYDFVKFFALGLAMAAKFALPRTKIPSKAFHQKTLDSLYIGLGFSMRIVFKKIQSKWNFSFDLGLGGRLALSSG
jgi:hypothetical protein